MKLRLTSAIAVFVAALAAFAGAAKFSCIARAQELDFELTATARVLPDVGPGLQAIRRDTAGRYYALTAPGASVMVFAPGGRFVGKIPSVADERDCDRYGADLDVDAAGQIYVADRGANLIRVFGNIETGGQRYGGDSGEFADLRCSAHGRRDCRSPACMKAPGSDSGSPRQTASANSATSQSGRSSGAQSLSERRAA